MRPDARASLCALAATLGVSLATRAQGADAPPAALAAPPAPQTPSAAPPHPDAAAPRPDSGLDLTSDVPPQTPYDLQRAEVRLAPEDRGLIAQLGRTVLALALVVVLLYAFVRLLLPRLMRVLPGGGGLIKILERTPLDTKHALVIVQVGEATRLLLGTGGEVGVQVLTELPAPQAGTFQQNMGDARPGGRDVKAN